jgi:hypothetical protein
VGRGPSGIAFDSANGYTYVANFPEVGGSATVSIIAWRSTPNTLTPYLVIGGIAASISLALAIVITFRKWIRNQSQKRIYSKNTCTPPVGTSPSTNPGTNLPSWRSPRGSA